ncbi:MAG: Ferripyoverdine receptor precursor [Pseudomonadota bacterium]
MRKPKVHIAAAPENKLRLKVLAFAVTLATCGAQAIAAESPPASIEEISVVGKAGLLNNNRSESSFGFSKPILETPRSISTLSEEAIELFGLTAVEDLVRFIPGVFTTTRFGIQGSIDVRNVSADTYFRGMKRLNLQGHARSVLAAMDSIEVVKGPPSPLYGMGKIGGYTNMSPKSGRATTGAYMERPEGFSQLILGQYERQEVSAGIGGPMSIGGKAGGYYVYGLVEDSGSYSRDVDVGQKLLQLSSSVDNVVGDWRLETGVNFQRSTTAGALTHRLTQGLVDDLEYVRGTPLVNLDLNGDGKIGYREMNTASPVRGNISANNQPLIQRYNWPLDASGKPLPLDKFPQVGGIPRTMFDYLTANPAADPTGRLRAQGVGGPLPSSGQVPVGFVLDPRTVGYDTLDPRRSGAFEKEVQADLMLFYADLVYDVNSDFTMKNQFFFDSMDQFKNSEQPGGGKQDVLVMEDKFTVTRRLLDLPQWLAVNTLASVNYRYTESTGHRYGGDFSSNRMDVMAQDNPMTANTTFWHPFDNPNIDAGGAPWTSDYRTRFTETGIGFLFDIDIYERTNVLLGGRYDVSRARNVEHAGTYNPTTGTAARPGAVRTVDDKASGQDDGNSWSISLSHELPYGIRPYLTRAISSVALDTNNNKLDNATIVAGHIGSAKITEYGVKTTLFDGRVFFALAHYEQTRTSVTEEEPGSVLGAEVSSTLTEGIEAEIKYQPFENFVVSLYGLNQETVFRPNLGGNVLVDARTLGFKDVLDASGKVIYPAEAFLYGGRAQLALPANLSGYEIKRGNPETQFGFNATYSLDNGLGFTLSGNHFSETYSGRLQTVLLPEVAVMDFGLFYDTGIWHFKLDIGNLLDEQYFRARTGDTLGEVLGQAMPGRTWRTTVKANF